MTMSEEEVEEEVTEEVKEEEQPQAGSRNNIAVQGNNPLAR